MEVVSIQQRRKRTKSRFSFKRLTSPTSLYSPKSLFNPSLLNALESSTFLMYAFLVAPEWTECGSGRWARVLVLPDLQATVVEDQSQERRKPVEGHGGSRIDGANELSKLSSERAKAIKHRGEPTAMCLSHMYPMLCKTLFLSLRWWSRDGCCRGRSSIQRFVSVLPRIPFMPLRPGVRASRGLTGDPKLLILGGREGSSSDERLGCSCLRSLCSGSLRLGDGDLGHS